MNLLNGSKINLDKDREYSYVFLTRGEIHAHTNNSISIHLRKNDPRTKIVSDGISTNTLKIVTVDPKCQGFFDFYRGNWYLINYLVYTGSSIHSGYNHYSFQYRFKKEFSWQEGEGAKILTNEEITKFRNTLKL